MHVIVNIPYNTYASHQSVYMSNINQALAFFLKVHPSQIIFENTLVSQITTLGDSTRYIFAVAMTTKTEDECYATADDSTSNNYNLILDALFTTTTHLAPMKADIIQTYEKFNELGLRFYYY
jgi:hypothetical protein